MLNSLFELFLCIYCTFSLNTLMHTSRRKVDYHNVFAKYMQSQFKMVKLKRNFPMRQQNPNLCLIVFIVFANTYMPHIVLPDAGGIEAEIPSEEKCRKFVHEMFSSQSLAVHV